MIAQLRRLAGAGPCDPSATPAALATRRRSFSARQSACFRRGSDSRSCATLLRVSGLGAGRRGLEETGEGCVCVWGGGHFGGEVLGQNRGAKTESKALTWGNAGRELRSPGQEHAGGCRRAFGGRWSWAEGAS